MSVFGKVGAGFLALAVLAGVVIGGWQLGWWMNAYSVNKQAHILQTSYGAQSAYAEEEQTLLVQIKEVDVQLTDPSTPADERDALEAQKASMVDQFCSLYSKTSVNPATNVAVYATSHC